MSQGQRSLVLRYLRRVVGAPRPGDVTDADLLARFIANRDETAFELLLWRHGTMVLHLCRDITRDEHAAEDAFQATFLTLVRKAASIRSRESLGAWLYQVAYRVALRARAKKPETTPVELAELPAVAELPDEASLRELRPLLHDEVQHLPAKYRTPIILCYFEGLTHDEAARQLGWPKGTVAGRLARARDMLRKRLTRRGLAWSAALAALTLVPDAASATAPAALIQATLRTGLLLAAGQAAGAVTPHVLALTEGVIRTMFWNKVKMAAAVVLTLGLVGGGVGLFAGGWTAGPPGDEQPALAQEDEQPPPRKPKKAAKLEDGGSDDARARAQSRENLKKIAIGMHNFLDTYGYFPPAAVYDKNGKPLLSWRVLLLPYLEQDNLYKQFRLNEPWDSAHNKKLLAHMPKVYLVPGQKEKNATFYQVFAGPSTIFERRRGAGGPAGLGGGGSTPAAAGAGGPGGAAAGPEGGTAGSAPTAGGAAGSPVGAADAPDTRGMGIADIVDGTSNTLMVIEGGSAVPWTKPEDLPFTPPNFGAANVQIQIPPLGGAFKDVIHAAFADGHVATLKKNFDKQIMSAAITRNGGEVVDLDQLMDPAPGAEPEQLKLENEELRQQVELAKEQVDRLKEQLELTKKLAELKQQNIVADRLKRERQQLMKQLEQLRDEAERLRREIDRLGEVQKPTPTRKR